MIKANNPVIEKLRNKLIHQTITWEHLTHEYIDNSPDNDDWRLNIHEFSWVHIVWNESFIASDNGFTFILITHDSILGKDGTHSIESNLFMFKTDSREQLQKIEASKYDITLLKTMIELTVKTKPDLPTFATEYLSL